jgi:hypothetical protein
MDDADDIKIELRDIKKDINSINVTIARTEQKIEIVESTIQEIKTDLRSDFVTNESFSPVRNFVYGTIALIATGFLTALIFLISWRGG